MLKQKLILLSYTDVYILEIFFDAIAASSDKSIPKLGSLATDGCNYEVKHG